MQHTPGDPSSGPDAARRDTKQTVRKGRGRGGPGTSTREGKAHWVQEGHDGVPGGPSPRGDVRAPKNNVVISVVIDVGSVQEECPDL